ncbi:hypothetical protein V5799_034232 [Amblyomma americanum]|uniref:Uncharacterized protein n=1 Tax=Amblyomma americanum TaxID=6943 RepID=A0AAQ4DL19_AMBAM
MENEPRGVTFGIIAYDVDYDDYADQCGSLNKFGEHSRLKALRKIADYYKSLTDNKLNETLSTKVVS